MRYQKNKSRKNGATLSIAWTQNYEKALSHELRAARKSQPEARSSQLAALFKRA